jgi:putative dehydrogenase
MKGVVGIIGLGIMGGAMAANLTAAGWRVIGFDIEPQRCAAAKAAGVEIADSVAALAAIAPTIMTSLPSAKAVIDVMTEIAAAGLAKRTILEVSTLSLDDKLEAERILRQAGHVALDCPLSGTGAQAKVRDLVVYASGDKAAIAAQQALFADFGRAAYDLGAYGNGSRMKFVANLLVAIHNVASAEAMVLGMKAGLDPHRIVELVGNGAGTSRVFELRAPMMAEARYEPATMRVSTWQKDMAVIGEFAASLNCPTPLFDASGSIYAAAMANGHGARDTAAVCAVLESMAGLNRL